MIPDRGDLLWLDFSPQAGREQAGHRPGLVLSPRKYNAPSGLMICVPVTSKSKGYPFEVLVPPGLPVSGVVLADHLKNFDWRSRRVRFLAKAPQSLVTQVLAKAAALLE